MGCGSTIGVARGRSIKLPRWGHFCRAKSRKGEALAPSLGGGQPSSIWSTRSKAASCSRWSDTSRRGFKLGFVEKSCGRFYRIARSLENTALDSRLKDWCENTTRILLKKACETCHVSRKPHRDSNLLKESQAIASFRGTARGLSGTIARILHDSTHALSSSRCPSGATNRHVRSISRLHASANAPQQ
jgi:hypothetical protein